MDAARAGLVGQPLRVLRLTFALWLALEALDLRGPDSAVSRYGLDAPSEHDLGPTRDAGPFC
jgi:hypothetical protein